MPIMHLLSDMVSSYRAKKGSEYPVVMGPGWQVD